MAHDVVPRRMLAMCRDLLRLCLARSIELQDALDRREGELRDLREQLRADKPNGNER